MNCLIMSSPYATKNLLKKSNKFLNGTNKRVCYIPAGYYDKKRIDGYSAKFLYSMGFRSCITFPLGAFYNKKFEDVALESSAIWLGGGCTPEFLFMLKHRGLLNKLKEYAKDDKHLLMGNSAGGIMMCEEIKISLFADGNPVGIKDFTSLGLVDYEVKPHWDSGHWYLDRKMFQNYVNSQGKTLYCLSEGMSIWDNGKPWERKFFGGMPEIIKPEKR